MAAETRGLRSAFKAAQEAVAAKQALKGAQRVPLSERRVRVADEPENLLDDGEVEALSEDELAELHETDFFLEDDTATREIDPTDEYKEFSQLIVDDLHDAGFEVTEDLASAQGANVNYVRLPLPPKLTSAMPAKKLSQQSTKVLDRGVLKAPAGWTELFDDEVGHASTNAGFLSRDLMDNILLQANTDDTLDFIDMRVADFLHFADVGRKFDLDDNSYRKLAKESFSKGLNRIPTLHVRSTPDGMEVVSAENMDVAYFLGDAKRTLFPGQPNVPVKLVMDKPASNGVIPKLMKGNSTLMYTTRVHGDAVQANLDMLSRFDSPYYPVIPARNDEQFRILLNNISSVESATLANEFSRMTHSSDVGNLRAFSQWLAVQQRKFGSNSTNLINDEGLGSLYRRLYDGRRKPESLEYKHLNEEGEQVSTDFMETFWASHPNKRVIDRYTRGSPYRWGLYHRDQYRDGPMIFWRADRNAKLLENVPDRPQVGQAGGSFELGLHMSVSNPEQAKQAGAIDDVLQGEARAASSKHLQSVIRNMDEFLGTRGKEAREIINQFFRRDIDNGGVMRGQKIIGYDETFPTVDHSVYAERIQELESAFSDDPRMFAVLKQYADAMRTEMADAAPMLTPHFSNVKRGLYLWDKGNWSPASVLTQMIEGYPSVFGKYKNELNTILVDGKYPTRINDTPEQAKNREAAFVKATQRVRRIIEDEGFDHIVYHNGVESRGNLSIIVWKDGSVKVPWNATMDPKNANPVLQAAIGTATAAAAMFAAKQSEETSEL